MHMVNWNGKSGTRVILVATDSERDLRLLNRMTCGFSHMTVGVEERIVSLDDS